MYVEGEVGRGHRGHRWIYERRLTDLLLKASQASSLSMLPVYNKRAYFSNLPANTTLKRLAAAVRSCWPIEQFYQDSGRLLRPRRLPGPALGWIAPHVPELVMLSYSFLAP